MARVPSIQHREDLPREFHEVYDAIVGTRGRVYGPFKILLHSPQIAGRIAHLGTHIRFETEISPKDHELAAMTVGRELNCQHIWAVHTGHARKCGIAEQVIVAIREGEAPKGLTEEDGQVVFYVHQLLRSHRVDETTFAAMLNRFGVKGLVDLTATVGYFCMLACVLNAFQVEPETGTDRL